ncbi:MAG: type II toxin-antitoxin system HicB family antitoxin [Campylobacteraceae bacterium]|nr:type II toxin-antitoxin system HicB family antitoxin [Campylobacteraceae bacterium]
MIKNIQYYQNIDYDILVSKLSKEDGGGYFAYYKDIPSVMGDGETEQEAIEDVKNAFRCFLKVSLQNQDPIPEPFSLQEKIRVNFNAQAGKIQELDRKVGKRYRTKLLNTLINKFLDGEIQISKQQLEMAK